MFEATFRLPCDRCGGRGWTLVAHAAPGTWPERCATCGGYGALTFGHLARTFRSACSSGVCEETLEKNARRVWRGESMRAATAFAVLEIACAAADVATVQPDQKGARHA